MNQALAGVSGLGAEMARWQARFPPGLPRPFADALAAAVALEEREQTGRDVLFLRHYLELMPKMRQEQLGATEGPAARFFRAPLRWDKLPHLSAAVARLQALLAGAGVAPMPIAGATLSELYVTTFYGGFMPLLYGYPADLAYFARDPRPLDEVIDHYLAAPLIHELAHLGRERESFPLYLDECVAGWLGVHVLRGFAYPRPGDDNALFAAPWFAQVGQALVRTAGLEPVLRAHAGVVRWSDTLPYANTLVRLGWEDYVARRPLHLLTDNFDPDPWLKLFFLGAAGEPLDGVTLASLRARPWCEVPAGQESPLDAAMLDDALAAMCLRNYQNERSFRVTSRPPRSPIEIDLSACRVTTAPGEDGFDPVRPAYLFPPAVAARLRARGIGGYTVELRALDARAELAAAILDGAPSRETPAFTLVRLGG